MLLSEPYKRLASDGLWGNNIVLVQNLALCPLLAVTGTATNGLGMGLATLVVLVMSNGIISLNRHLVPAEVRIPVFVLLIASLVTLVDLCMNAWMHEMHKVLGLFIALIVTNCAILGRAESFASKNSLALSLWDGLVMGAGFTFVLVVLGAAREIVSSGTLFANASLLLGDSFSFLELTLIPNYKGFLLTALPPGGFIMLAFIIVAKRLVDNKRAAKLSQVDVNEAIPEL
ncbi:electron transport complex subunit E [Methylicorpusculum sp.]|uniref:electron transport complex subunit E n=1 Tax=Methylicorpusculum sp. TaxID=2713644 RepID=UPI00271D7D5F|nr:electron transport complex subunit E [Methylicorpusculum sp.]MDO8846195.1 electron transport complex subunit E [Methylicorpusculum sp.]MDP2177901.1 electron transport complex subunit E [Methylicorpusculum sp.]MDP3528173.1 electron transport complex subunit E [Methylicorpusculum sp.]MDZ4150034.1 electron transport complex subunit E [Methylicorpusculum sp.]